jgi:hypothetical protein
VTVQDRPLLLPIGVNEHPKAGRAALAAGFLHELGEQIELAIAGEEARFGEKDVVRSGGELGLHSLQCRAHHPLQVGPVAAVVALRRRDGVRL